MSEQHSAIVGGASGAGGAATRATSPKEQKYRAKYRIPDDAFAAVGAGGYAAFDGDFVTLQHVGLGRGVVGKGVKRIPLSSVTAVQIKPAGALVNGFIQFTIPGGNERRSGFGAQTRDAAGDENSIIFPAPMRQHSFDFASSSRVR